MSSKKSLKSRGGAVWLKAESKEQQDEHTILNDGDFVTEIQPLQVSVASPSSATSSPATLLRLNFAEPNHSATAPAAADDTLCVMSTSAVQMDSACACDLPCYCSSRSVNNTTTTTTTAANGPSTAILSRLQQRTAQRNSKRPGPTTSSSSNAKTSANNKPAVAASSVVGGNGRATENNVYYYEQQQRQQQSTRVSSNGPLNEDDVTQQQTQRKHIDQILPTPENDSQELLDAFDVTSVVDYTALVGPEPPTPTRPQPRPSSFDCCCEPGFYSNVRSEFIDWVRNTPPLTMSLKKKYALLVLWNILLGLCPIGVGMVYQSDIKNAQWAKRDGKYGMSTTYEDMGFYPMGGVLTLCASCLFDILAVLLITGATLLRFGYERNYARLLIINFFVTTTALILLFSNQEEANEHLNNYFANAVKKLYDIHNPDSSASRFITTVQSTSMCCGLDNVTDWSVHNLWIKQHRVPNSCCNDALPEGDECVPGSPYLFNKPCRNEGMAVFGRARDYSKMLAALKLVVIAFDIITSALIFRERYDNILAARTLSERRRTLFNDENERVFMETDYLPIKRPPVTQHYPASPDPYPPPRPPLSDYSSGEPAVIPPIVSRRVGDAAGAGKHQRDNRGSENVNVRFAKLDPHFNQFKRPAAEHMNGRIGNRPVSETLVMSTPRGRRSMLNTNLDDVVYTHHKDRSSMML